MRNMKSYWIYILCSKRNGTLYIGITNNLERRIYEHKNKISSNFPSRYAVNMLVYAEEYSDVRDAIDREKQLKKWNRQWKLRLIEENNPDWVDLFEEA